MDEVNLTESGNLTPTLARRLEAAWKAGGRPRVEEYLTDVPEPEQASVLCELLILELIYRDQAGENPRPEDYLDRFPAHADLIRELVHQKITGLKQLPIPAAPKAPRTKPDDADEEPSPVRLGRYRILARQGSGGFGVVYQAFDEELARVVAIKIPSARWMKSEESTTAYLAEGRLLAQLDHPGIVPIYDVGLTDEGTCYLVSKFIDGGDLRQRLAKARLTRREAVAIVAQVAEALDYAHQHGLVHRDIKPANILLDREDQAVVADFGLALRREDVGTGPTYAGTPAYMSPEQARGAGHRVDARSDVYSLGVVLYELLTGRHPYRTENRTELLEKIRAGEAQPPRQVDGTIPKELDRICLKALANRARERYSTAIDLAEDLRLWLAGTPETAGGDDRSGPGVQHGPAVWAKRVWQILLGQGRALAPPGRARHRRICRGRLRGDRGPALTRPAQTPAGSARRANLD